LSSFKASRSSIETLISSIRFDASVNQIIQVHKSYLSHLQVSLGELFEHVFCTQSIV
jgi:hypothetical protein